MTLKEICSKINPFARCREHEIPLWQCPQFLFVIMGILTIISTLTAYVLGNRYIEDLLIVDLIVIALSLVMFLISFAVTNSFERLAEANRMKSEFVRIVSHQLRTPLTNFKWTLESMPSKDQKSEQARNLEILRENSKRMEELVGDLVTVSRIKEGTLFLRKSEVDLEELLKGIADRFQQFIKARNLKFSVQCQKGLPQISTDPSQVKLLMEILLENGISYSRPRGEVKVTLEEKDSHIRFAVEDDGIGIPEKDKKFIFKQFFRSSNVTQYRPDGTGLGLFIAKSVVNRLKGEIGFKSKEGEGSIFWFALPIK